MNLTPDQLSMLSQMMQSFGQGAPGSESSTASGAAGATESDAARDATSDAVAGGGAAGGGAAGGSDADDSGGYSHDVWNAYVVMFLGKLSESFPKAASIVDTLEEFSGSVQKNSHQAMVNFHSDISPFSSLIAQRNDEFMLGKYRDVRLLAGINFKKLWEHASVETKNNLWNHINTLWTMSLTMQTFTSDQIRVVESVAGQMKSMFLQDENSRQLLKNMAGVFGIQVNDEHLDEIGSQDFGTLLRESVSTIRESGKAAEDAPSDPVPEPVSESSKEVPGVPDK